MGRATKSDDADFGEIWENIKKFGFYVGFCENR
jgi:hypothetical protein